MAWNREEQGLEGFQDYCWYSWKEQVKSLERLRQETFEWVLPGHGDRIHLPASGMREAMTAMLQRYGVS
ncbi:hypothetical protein [Paenibacillus cremeus]|uniref:hypothetical protein n=1 Tax=Paenibacillus cremeus TaxID=2163881 RepID=UPI0016481D36|nr:hypothetical protein [Paenibacillus cremeus]